MSKYIRRLILLGISPLILFAFCMAELVWWIMEDEFDAPFMWRTFMKAWDK